MEIVGQPSGLVAFTGNQLWPHLDALAQWGKQLTAVHLIVAHGDDEPGGSAERLEKFIRRYLPHAEIRRFGPVNDDDPLRARDAITEAAPAGTEWLVDLSGGTRLMFAGGVLAAPARTI